LVGAAAALTSRGGGVAAGRGRGVDRGFGAGVWVGATVGGNGSRASDAGDAIGAGAGGSPAAVVGAGGRGALTTPNAMATNRPRTIPTIAWALDDTISGPSARRYIASTDSYRPVRRSNVGGCHAGLSDSC
jgi:hypothetical protein